jgi:hypothetical protein
MDHCLGFCPRRFKPDPAAIPEQLVADAAAIEIALYFLVRVGFGFSRALGDRLIFGPGRFLNFPDFVPEKFKPDARAVEETLMPQLGVVLDVVEAVESSLRARVSRLESHAQGQVRSIAVQLVSQAGVV